jgi:hypothetical protein
LRVANHVGVIGNTGCERISGSVAATKIFLKNRIAFTTATKPQLRLNRFSEKDKKANTRKEFDCI